MLNRTAIIICVLYCSFRLFTFLNQILDPDYVSNLTHVQILLNNGDVTTDKFQSFFPRFEIVWNEMYFIFFHSVIFTVTRGITPRVTLRFLFSELHVDLNI